MANWGANHGAISYGHIGADLITLSSMLRIPVNMHNVSDNDIYTNIYVISYSQQPSEKTIDILENHEPDRVSDAVDKEIKEILAESDKKRKKD